MIGNYWDELSGYDIPYAIDTAEGMYRSARFSDQAFALDTPLANYAKSGTSDDVIRPFNVDVTSKQRTNYGLWNAVIRIDLAKLDSAVQPDQRDLTVACVGECNTLFTGPRDGKSLHKFLTRELLKRAGTRVENGFFSQYERYIRRVTPSSEMNCGKREHRGGGGTSGIGPQKKGFWKLFGFGADEPVPPVKRR
jgi:hypothetical protein